MGPKPPICHITQLIVSACALRSYTRQNRLVRPAAHVHHEVQRGKDVWYVGNINAQSMLGINRWILGLQALRSPFVCHAKPPPPPPPHPPPSSFSPLRSRASWQPPLLSSMKIHGRACQDAETMLDALESLWHLADHIFTSWSRIYGNPQHRCSSRLLPS